MSRIDPAIAALSKDARYAHYILHGARFVVKESSASEAGSRWMHKRKHVAVLLVDSALVKPTMISTRARGVLEVVRVWNSCFVGKTDNCEYARALVEANALARKMNGEL